jgi:hypothetical protein
MKLLIFILCVFSTTLVADEKCLDEICVGSEVHVKLPYYGEACAKVISFTPEGKVVVRHENRAVFKAHFAEVDLREVSPALNSLGELRTGKGVHYKKGCLNGVSTVKRVFANKRVLLGKGTFKKPDGSAERRIWRDAAEVSPTVQCMNGICVADRVVELGARVCKEGAVNQVFANGLVQVACDGPGLKWRLATDLTKVPK